jgi:hypothetical protein
MMPDIRKEANMEITGTLKNAIWFNDHRAPNIRGQIHGDFKNRFADGETVYTSTVLEDMGDGLYRTRNSIYKVEFASEDYRPADLPRKNAFPLRDKCEEKAKRLNMPHFTMLACDNFTVDLVKAWIKKATQNKVPYQKVIEAQSLLEAIKEWREDNAELCKVPD